MVSDLTTHMLTSQLYHPLLGTLASSSVLKEEYFCNICCCHFHFTKPELLKHKQEHKT